MASLSQGTTVTVGGASVLATRVSVTNGDESSNSPRISVAHLGSNPDAEEPYELTWAAPDDSGAGAKNVQIDYMGGFIEPGGTTSLAITGPISFSATCTVVSSSVTAQVGDVIRGSATFRFK